MIFKNGRTNSPDMFTQKAIEMLNIAVDKAEEQQWDAVKAYAALSSACSGIATAMNTKWHP